MGCYPLFACQDWSALADDVTGLGPGVLTLTLVADPFGNFHPDLLRSIFDVVVPFKEHLVTDLTRPIDQIVSKHHARYAQSAARHVTVELVERPIDFLDEWWELYAQLIIRRSITGMAAFSKRSFARQLTVPGLVMFRAIHEDITAGLDLWYVQGDVAYFHLVALSEIGYRMRASHRLKWHILQHFSDKVRWLDLGAGAGTSLSWATARLFPASSPWVRATP